MKTAKIYFSAWINFHEWPIFANFVRINFRKWNQLANILAKIQGKYRGNMGEIQNKEIRDKYRKS